MAKLKCFFFFTNDGATMIFLPLAELGLNNFLCAQLLHFFTDFDLTFTEALSSSALGHIVGFFQLDYI
jgi:hypothetical protein